MRSSTRGDEAAAGLADTAAAEAAVRGATERALAASEGRMARRKLDCGEGDWDRERAVNCAANIPGILSGRWAGGLLPFFVQCSEEGGAWRRCSAATEQVKRATLNMRRTRGTRASPDPLWADREPTW